MVSPGLLRVLVAVSLAACVYGNYFIACPNTFRPEIDFSCEVSYVGAEAVNVEVKLGIPGEPPLSSRTLPLENGRRHISITIPTVVPDGTYNLTVVGRAAADSRELFRNSTILQDESDTSLLFIQIDKPIYKPLQTVKFRVVCVDQDLKPRTVPTDISIFDKNDNKLEEWLAVSGQNGVIEKSYKLSDLPPLGEWKIKARNNIAMAEKDFSVDKYVLPKFEVTAEADPKFLITGDGGNDDFTVKVKAKFTYGKDVPGKATFIFGEQQIITESAILNYDAEGFHKQQFKLSEFDKVKTWNGLKFSVNVTEDATRVNESSNQVTILLHNRRTKMEFLPSSDQVFRPGQEVKFQLKVKDIVDNIPAHVDSTVVITAYMGGKSVNQSLQVDRQGMVSASFVIPATETRDYGIQFTATLKVSSYTLREYHTVLPYRTKLNTTVEVDIPTSQPIGSGGSFDIEITTNVRGTAQITRMGYMVLARGVVVDSGPIQMIGSSKTHTIASSRWMSPQAHVVVYGIVTDGKMYEVISDYEDVQVEGVFDNTVSLEFSSDNSRAGTDVDITVRSTANSKYYILAVDKSVLLLGTGNDLSQADVTNRIGKFSLDKTRSYTDGPEPHVGGADAFIMPRPGPGGSTNDAPTSAGQIFTQRGLVYMTDVIVEDSPSRNRWPIDAIQDGAIMFKGANAESAVDSPAATGTKTQFAEVGSVRKSFPEAWLWMDGMVDSNGVLTFTKKVPDTITEWQATAFAMSDTRGLAISQAPAKMTSFQPFFASMTLPYAMQRGEITELRVTINNYIVPEQSTIVKVTLKQSSDFSVLEDANGEKVLVSKDIVRELTVKPNIPGLVIFKIKPTILGQVGINVVAQPEQSTGEKGDSLIRKVLVKPEGFVRRVVEGRTVELDVGDDAFTSNVSITFPDNVVPDSKRIEVKVTGDVMGPTVDGLEHLIQMPTGCGEQNMITLVPNIVVYNYLKTVNRLTTDIEDRAIANMKAGYQRELQYLRKDHSFSAFGDSDPSGSTWLTAFVMKCFSMAKNEITVDANMMKRAFTFVKSSQEDDGTFSLRGRVIHSEMLGGTSGANQSLTAFIFIALKESETFLSLADEPAIAKAKKYLEDQVSAGLVTSTYEMAIVAYALTLADSSMATILLDKLKSTDTKKPWDRPTTDEPNPPEGQGNKRAMIYHPPKATSSDVETWAYVLMAHAERQEIVDGRPIMKWLLSQQNGQGGFYSSKDTVLALQALAEYAAKVYAAPQTDITLNVRSNKESHQFKVQLNQLLLLQSYKFTYPDDTTFVELSATGRGLALVKILYQYNTMKEPQKPTTDTKVISQVLTEKINEKLFRARTCVKSSENKGMLIVTMGMQTEMSVSNIEQLEKDPNIKRVDYDENDLHIYYEAGLPDFQCSDVQLQQDAPVINRKPASFKAYFYYSPEYETEGMYTVSEAKPLIDICKMCEGNACPRDCDKCKHCGSNCPSDCDTSGAKTWKYDGMMLAMAICFLLSLIMAM